MLKYRVSQKMSNRPQIKGKYLRHPESRGLPSMTVTYAWGKCETGKMFFFDMGQEDNLHNHQCNHYHTLLCSPTYFQLH